MIQIRFKTDPAVLTAYLASRPAAVRDSLMRTMARLTISLQRYIVTGKLQGQVLHQRSGNLARNIAQEVREESDAITGVVGVGRTAWYGKVHEFGGAFTIREHMANSKIGTPFSVRAHMATFPERSFMRTALAEQAPDIRQKLAEAVAVALRT